MGVKYSVSQSLEARTKSNGERKEKKVITIHSYAIEIQKIKEELDNVRKKMHKVCPSLCTRETFNKEEHWGQKELQKGSQFITDAEYIFLEKDHAIEMARDVNGIIADPLSWYSETYIDLLIFKDKKNTHANIIFYEAMTQTQNFKAIQTQSKRYAFIPLLVSYDNSGPLNHWVLLIVDKTYPVIFYLNPAAQPQIPDEITDFQKTLNCGVLQNPIDLQRAEKGGKSDLGLINCGPYIIEIAEVFKKAIDENKPIIGREALHDLLSSILPDDEAAHAETVQRIRKRHAEKVIVNLMEKSISNLIMKDKVSIQLSRPQLNKLVMQFPAQLELQMEHLSKSFKGVLDSMKITVAIKLGQNSMELITDEVETLNRICGFFKEAGQGYWDPLKLNHSAVFYFDEHDPRLNLDFDYEKELGALIAEKTTTIYLACEENDWLGTSNGGLQVDAYQNWKTNRQESTFTHRFKFFTQPLEYKYVINGDHWVPEGNNLQKDIGEENCISCSIQ